MPVSSLVLKMDERFEELGRSLLASDARITLGEEVGGFLPLVTETDSIREARDLAESLLQAPGVTDVQLVSFLEEDAVYPAPNSDLETVEGQNHGA